MVVYAYNLREEEETGDSKLACFKPMEYPVLKSKMIVPEKHAKLNRGTPSHVCHPSCTNPNAPTDNTQKQIKMQTLIQWTWGSF